MGERSRRGLRPLDPRAASGWPAAKVGGALFTDQRTSLQHPASRRAAGAMPLPESLRNRTRSAPGEARPLLRGAQCPRGGGKLRGFAAHARSARERPFRALFSAGCPRRAIRQQDCWVQRYQPSTRGWLDVSGGGILKGGELCAPLPYKRFRRRRLKAGSKGPARPFERPSRVARSGRSPGRPLEAPLERPSSADFLGAQEVGPPAGAGPGDLCRRRRLP